jgi:transcriptional regulator with XRE-family HTH domain
MSYTLGLMDAAKTAAGIASDYRLAQVLGVTRATVSTWRSGRHFPGYSMAYALADMAGVDRGAALVGIGVDRAGLPENRPALRRIGAALRADSAAYDAASG